LAGSIYQGQDLPTLVIRSTRDGGVEQLFENGGALGINASGVVVGYLGDGRTAFRYDTSLHPLQGLPGGFSAATAINDAGVVVGSSRNADGSERAVQWDADGAVSLVQTDLPSHPDYRSRATVVTSSGTVYGQSTFTWITFPYYRAVRFENGSAIDLGALGKKDTSPTANQSGVTAVNSKGVAVGWSSNMPKDRTHQAVIFDGAGGVTELAKLIPEDMRAKYQLFSSIAINDAGQILVEGVRREDYMPTALRLDPQQ
jgi:probable HAF family extracellular repeat protein